MATKSAFVIVLSGEERAELEQPFACYTLSHTVVKRVKVSCAPPAGRAMSRSRAAGGARLRAAGLHRLVVERGVTDASASMIWRWLHEALKPWQQRSWIFVRDPCLPTRAAGCWISTSGASRAAA